PNFETLGVAVKTFLNLAEAFDVSCYWSPAGGGFGAHFDRQSVMIVQLEGSKRWQYGARPALPAPGKNFLATTHADEMFRRAFPWFADEPPLPQSDQLEEQLLTPGDLLYLPAGTWHRTRAGDSSLALTLTFFHRNFASFLPAVWEELLEHDEGWRSSLPLVPLDDAPVSGLPPTVDAFLADRLAQLATVVGRLRPDDLAHLWRAEVARYRFEPHQPEAASAEREKVKRKEAFVVPDPVFCVTPSKSSGPGQLHVFCGNRSIRLPIEAGPFIEHLGRSAKFTAEEAIGWTDDDEALAWADVRQALEALLEVGLIRRAR
ncbi:MAG: JmjC domain-containing protein, partial [Acidimicrobiia bacterium]